MEFFLDSRQYFRPGLMDNEEGLVHGMDRFGHRPLRPDGEIRATLKDAGGGLRSTPGGGWAALHNAAWFGGSSIVDLLIEAGEDPNAETREQLTPLHCAVKNPQPAVVECLLKKRIVNIEAVDQFGVTPFHMACKANNVSVMEILPDYGASLETHMKGGSTPLVWACLYGQLPVLELLLRRGADINVKWKQTHSLIGKVVELGLLGLAKAYRNEAIIRLVKRFGATSFNQSAVEEAKAFQPIAIPEEAYDTPQVLDIVLGR